MSQAPLLFDSRFRWVILQKMTELRNIAQDPLDPRFDQLYGAIRDAVWEAVSTRPRQEPLDPAKIELTEVQHYLHTTVESIRKNVLPSG